MSEPVVDWRIPADMRYAMIAVDLTQRQRIADLQWRAEYSRDLVAASCRELRRKRYLLPRILRVLFADLLRLRLGSALRVIRDLVRARVGRAEDVKNHLRRHKPDDLLCRMWDFLEWVDRRDASGS